MRRAAKVALTIYPLRFRRRYGEEMRALLDDLPVGPGTVLDLLRGALVAHMRPSTCGRGTMSAEDRLRLSASGILACWVLFAIAGLAFYKTTEGGLFTAAADAHPSLAVSLLAIEIAAALGSCAVLAAAAPVARAVLLAPGPLRREVRRPLAVSLTGLGCFALLSAGIVAVAHKGSLAVGAAAALLGVWSAGGIGAAGLCAGAARRFLFAACVPRSALRLAALLGILLTMAMWLIVVAAGVYAVALSGLPLSGTGNGPGGLIAVEPSIVLQLATMVAGAGLATVSSVRSRWALGDEERAPAAT